MTVDLNRKAECIREMIDQRLKGLSAAELANVPAAAHIDEDVIAAFVEGRLADDECRPVVSHLADCGFCRRASAEFVRLENQIDADSETAIEEQQPRRLEAVLARLRSVVPSTNEEVVFAYQTPEEEQRERTTPKDSNANSEQTK